MRSQPRNALRSCSTKEPRDRDTRSTAAVPPLELLQAGVSRSQLDNPRYVRAAPVLEEPGHFDATFFGYSPIEARTMDPQHRLLLEVAWEALEHAGIAPERLRGSSSGVFVGLTATDYAHVLAAAGPEGLDGYFVSGNSPNAAAGRISAL